MTPVTAYQDSAGKLHKSPRDAIDSDFVNMIQSAWGSMPDQRDRGDPVVIARILVLDNYSARRKLLDALKWYDDQRAEMDERVLRQSPQGCEAPND